MVDPKNNERTVETEARPDRVARRVWVKPRLETIEITETRGPTTTHTVSDGAATSMS
jgi:hypothetical protein